MKISVHAYIELTKPRIAVMVVITAALGYFLAAGGFEDWTLFAIAMLGTALAAGGASVLNQYLERDVDARMERTCNRPIPAGTVAPLTALTYGTIMTVGGCLLLAANVNLLSAFLALLSAFLYVLVYTPMKRLSWLNTSVGAVPGAMPPLIGWAAAAGDLGLNAWALFAILFVWQHPHFFAIAWMYRDDYARGGFKMLPVVKPDGAATFRQSLLFGLILLPVSALPAVLGLTGWVYLSGAIILGMYFLSETGSFARIRSVDSARRTLRASIIYLPALFVLIVLDAQL